MFEKIILVTRKTRLEGLVERFNTRAQARFYINHEAELSGSGGPRFELYEQEHETYIAAVERLQDRLGRLAKLQCIERTFLPNYLFAETDLVVTVGVDGLVVNTAKYLHGQPLVAVNPDPAHIDGVLLPFKVEDAHQAVRRVLEGRYQVRPVSMAAASLADGQRLLAFNDVFIGVRSHTSARYTLYSHGRQEQQSSSGIIVSTGAGSSGWLSSLFNMAEGIVGQFGGGVAARRPELPWEGERLVFVVREPFVSKTSGASLVCGFVTPEAPLVLKSHMAEGGVIFSDGMESDFLAFNAGATATIGLAAHKTQLVVG